MTEHEENQQQTEATEEQAEQTFEEAMKQMEEIVAKLEEGDVPLEKAISLFQEGMTLSKTCHFKLKNVEDKMDQIVSEDGEMKDYSVDEESSS